MHQNVAVNQLSLLIPRSMWSWGLVSGFLVFGFGVDDTKIKPVFKWPNLSFSVLSRGFNDKLFGN